MLKRVVAVALVGAAGLGPALPVAAAQAETIILQVDRPAAGQSIDGGGAFGGWAVDQAATTSPGINAISIYMDGDATSGQYLGQATLGLDRSDVAAQLGNPAYRTAGWSFNLAGINLTGQHAFTFIARGANSATATVTVSSVTVTPPRPSGTTTGPAAGSAPATTSPTSPSAAFAVPPTAAPPATGSGLPSTATTPPGTPGGFPPPPGGTPPSTGGAPGGFAPPASGAATAPGSRPPSAPAGTPGFPAPPATSGTPGQPAPAGTGTATGLPSINNPASSAAQPPTAVPAPATLSINNPASGVTINGPIQLSGSVSFVPASGTVAYQIANQNGNPVASGTLPVVGTPGGPGFFSGTVNPPAALAGPSTITVTATGANGAVAGTASVSVTLSGPSAPGAGSGDGGTPRPLPSNQ